MKYLQLVVVIALAAVGVYQLVGALSSGTGGTALTSAIIVIVLALAAGFTLWRHWHGAAVR